MREVPTDEVRALELDLVIYQTPRNYLEDGPAILSAAQRRLPAIYLEHNTPRPDPVASRHLIDDPHMLLVHVTHFNRLMWDNGRTPTLVVEHSVALNPAARYSGHLPSGLVCVNGMQQRPRIAGFDIFQHLRDQLPLRAVGMGTEQYGGLGDVPYRDLHRTMAGYRFLFSPMRYTSLPLAVIEALMIGMPVVALATTELPTVLEDGVTGFVSCDLDYLASRMRHLLEDPGEARRVGANGRALALERFGLERFARDWNSAFALLLDRQDNAHG